jgi:hypothetical protein
MQIKAACGSQISAAEPNYRVLLRRTSMMDAVMMAIVFVFFALSIAYCYVCDRL